MLIPQKLSGLIVLSVALLLLSNLPSAAETRKVYGYAINKDGRVAYLEEHLATYQNGKIAAIETNFYNPNAERIARQLSDFTQGAQYGSYDFVDERYDYSDGVRVTADRILVYRQKKSNTEKKEKSIPRNDNQVVGQGFYQFITANLEPLVQGRILSAKLVLPAQMGQFDVQVRKSSIQGDRLVLTVELDNWLLRLFAPDAEIEYDMKNRRLLRYRGISMVSNSNRKNHEVVTTYDYSQQPSLLAYLAEARRSAAPTIKLSQRNTEHYIQR